MKPRTTHSLAKSGLAERTVSNALWNLVPFAWSLCLGLLILPFIIRRLGLEHFGLYGIFTAMLAPLSLANLGFGEATIKFVAQHIHAGDEATAAKYVRTTLCMNLLVGLAGGALIFFAGAPIAFRCFNIAAADQVLTVQCFRLVAVGWVLAQISAVFMGIPSALQAFRRAAVVQVAVTTLGMGVSALLVWRGHGLFGYVSGTVLGNLASVMAWYFCSRAYFPTERLVARWHPEIWLRAFHFGGWQACAQLGGLLANQSERFLLGAFLNPTAIGIYNTAHNLESRAYFVAFKMSEVLFPLFSALSQAESLAQKANKLQRATWLLTTLGVLVLMPLIPLAGPFLTLWVSLQVAEKATVVLQVLALGGMLGCSTNASYFFLLGNGQTVWIALLAIVTGLVTVTTSACVLPLYGLKAAAWSGVAAMLAQQIFLSLRMLPRLFQHALPVSQICISFYAPLVIGLGLAFAFSVAGVARWIVNWPLLILAYAALASLTAILIWLANSLTPAGREHANDVRRILQLARAQAQKTFVTPVCVA